MFITNETFKISFREETLLNIIILSISTLFTLYIIKKKTFFASGCFFPYSFSYIYLLHFPAQVSFPFIFNVFFHLIILYVYFAILLRTFQCFIFINFLVFFFASYLMITILFVIVYFVFVSFVICVSSRSVPVVLLVFYTQTRKTLNIKY